MQRTANGKKKRFYWQIFMAKTHTVLQIFVASPTDVRDERNIVKEVIDEFNSTWSDSNSIRYELLSWETHTRPGFGEDAQDVINSQIGDDYDIFLGIMWVRFGSRTNRAESGTEEEFERAYKRWTESSKNVQIMFYFKDAAISPSEVDPVQLGKVQAFKNKISNHGGLYHEFVDQGDFQTKIRMHLTRIAQDWRKSPKDVVSIKNNPTPLQTDRVLDPLANLSALIDTEEEGFLELLEHGDTAMKSVCDIVNNMGIAIVELNNNIQQRTEDFQKFAASNTQNVTDAKRICDEAANDFEVFADKISVEIPRFNKQHSNAMDATGKVAVIFANELKGNHNDPCNIVRQIKEYHLAISKSVMSVTSLRDITALLPRMTTAFHKARKRAVTVMDDLIVQLRNAENLTGYVEDSLNHMLESSNEDGNTSS